MNAKPLIWHSRNAFNTYTMKEEIYDSVVREWQAEDAENSATSDYADSHFVGKSYADSQLRIIRTTKDYDLSYIPSALSEKINLAPKFQRRARWNKKKRSLLIESFLLNIPVPPIFLFEHEFDQYEVVDGRQRLEAIRDYLSDKFSLTGLQFWTHLNGKKFSKLPEDFKRGLQRRSLTAIILLAESSKAIDSENDVRMVLFERLNTGGVKLNAQEIRNAIYLGEFKELLYRLSELPEFRKAWGIPIIPSVGDPKDIQTAQKKLQDNLIYRQMLDIELVLRFYAVREVVLNDLKGSMATLLTKTMEKHSKETDANYFTDLENMYKECLSALWTIFGEDLFKNTKLDQPKPARNLYDAFMVAYSLIPEKDKIAPASQIVAALKAKLLDDSDYEMVIEKGNSTEKIKSRVNWAKDILTA